MHLGNTIYKHCDKYKCRYNVRPHIHREDVIDFVTNSPGLTQTNIIEKMGSTRQIIKKHLHDKRIERKIVFANGGIEGLYFMKGVVTHN